MSRTIAEVLRLPQLPAADRLTDAMLDIGEVKHGDFRLVLLAHMCSRLTASWSLDCESIL